MIQRFSKDKVGFLAVVLISVAFIIIRLLIPIKFDGSYIDEYWHITSGVSLLETGKPAFFYNGEGGYKRGLLMSLWVGLWVTQFGKSILVAKLAPISIAIVNYFLFLFLSIKLFEKKRFQLLLLSLYTLSPWLLFNHTYIRFYVLNELFLLVLLVIGYQLYNALKEENWKNSSLFFILAIMLNILSLATMNDQSEYMLLIATAVMLSGLFIFEFNTVSIASQSIVSTVFGNVLFSSKAYRTLLVLVVVVTGFIVMDGNRKIEFLLNGQLQFTSQDDRKYTWLFWEKNGVISVFFVLAVITFWWKNKGFERIILSVAGILFLIHIAASEDLQIIRGILYFIPLYYVAAVIGVSKIFRISNLRDRSEWVWCVVISSIFLVTTVINVTREFYWGPEIKREINYIEYARVYEAVSDNCQDKLIIEASPSAPFVANFYDVDVDYVLSATGDTEKDSLYIVDSDTGRFKTVWGNIPVITDINYLKSLDRDICLIVRSPSKRRFIPSAVEDMLKNTVKSWNFHNIGFYLLDKENLSGYQ